MGITESDVQNWLNKNPDLQVEGDLTSHVVERSLAEASTFKEVQEILAEQERIKAREENKRPRPNFKSKTEERAWDEWLPTIQHIEAYYEPIRVYLNSGSYKPDIVIRRPTNMLWFVEVKGSWNAYASGRSSKKSLIEASKMYWWLGRWFSLLPEKGTEFWNLEEIK